MVNSNEAPVPHDLDAERAVLGNVLVSPVVIGQLAWMLRPDDFYAPGHRAIYAAVLGFHERGEQWDGRAVLNACVAAGQPVEAADIPSLMADYGTAWQRDAERLVDLHARRDLVYAAAHATELARDPRHDIGETVAELSGFMRSIANPASKVPDSLRTMDEVADRPADRAPWVIPGMFRQGWRAVVVGPEGGGKSLLLLQCAVLASAGIHPLNYERIAPVVVLVVDLENPDDEVSARVRKMRQQVANQRGDWQPTRPWIWEEPGGIDLRSRKHRAELDAICTHVKPDLVCLGPIYKSYGKRAGERGHEDAVNDLQGILDDLRTRHRFALMLEHHAPLDASNGSSSKRLQRPADTALWQRWPDIGRGMTPDDERPRSVMHLTRFRGDRVRCSWPDRVEYGQVFPWQGVWKDAPADAF